MLESLKETKERLPFREKSDFSHALSGNGREMRGGREEPFSGFGEGNGEGRPHLFSRLYISPPAPRCYACKFSRYESLGMRGLEKDARRIWEMRTLRDMHFPYFAKLFVTLRPVERDLGYVKSLENV